LLGLVTQLPPVESYRRPPYTACASWPFSGGSVNPVDYPQSCPTFHCRLRKRCRSTGD